MSRFMGWVGGTHTMRYHAHYHTGGMGHVYQQRYKSFPVQDDEHFRVVSRYVERNALRAGLVGRAEEWRWGSLWRWLQKPEPKPNLLSRWPLPRLANWVDRVNEPLSEKELEAVRRCAQRGCPLGEESWVESIARRLNLESTIRPRGRPRKCPKPEKEA
jgi:putative transposase